jgi:hypothetical protein
MTLALKEATMNREPTPEQRTEFEADKRTRAEKDLALNRKMSTLMHGWKRCGNRVCRRAHRCAGFPLRCVVKHKERQLTPEQRANAKHRFKLALDKRRAEFAAGAKPMKPEEIKLMMRKRAAEKKRKRAARRAEALRQPPPAAAPIPPQGAGNVDSAAAYEPPPLSPEKVERINRIWNDYVASLPAVDAEATEDAGKTKREPGPRITML